MTSHHQSLSLNDAGIESVSTSPPVTPYALSDMIFCRQFFFVIALLCAVCNPSLAQTDSPISVSVRFDREAATPGGRAVLAVIYDMDEHWHINTENPKPPEGLDLFAIPTTLTVTPPPGARVGPTQWPKPYFIDVPVGKSRTAKYGVFGQRAVVLVPVLIDVGTSGELSFDVTTTFQACNDKTCLAEEEVTTRASLRIDPAAASITSWSGDFAAFDVAGFSASRDTLPTQGVISNPAPAAGPLTFDVFGWKFSINPSGTGGLALLALISLAGGFILNFTPCVLPVVPLKVVALSQGGKTRGKTLLLGLLMCAGIIAFWLAIGATIALSTSFKSASTIISHWWFAVGMGVFMAAMGLSMFGAFTLGLPNWVYTVNPRHDTLHGSFLFGVLTAVLATPCVAPLGGTAMGWAAFQPAAKTLLVFSAIGIGMALPYLVLAANPSWVEKVPRAGAMSELVKQIMGLLMFAVAAFFIGAGLLTLRASHPWIVEVVHWWFAAAFSAIAGAWLIFRAWPLARLRGRAVGVILGLLLIASGVGIAQHFTGVARENFSPETAAGSHGPWKRFSHAAFEQARSDNKVIVVLTTAVWCINCKPLEAQFRSPEAIAALTAPGVAAFKVDLSAKDGPGSPSREDWEYLRSIREAGPPVLTVYAPGRAEPIFKSNAYTLGGVLAAMREAGADIRIGAVNAAGSP